MNVAEVLFLDKLRNQQGFWSKDYLDQSSLVCEIWWDHLQSLQALWEIKSFYSIDFNTSFILKDSSVP